MCEESDRAGTRRSDADVGGACTHDGDGAAGSAATREHDDSTLDHLLEALRDDTGCRVLIFNAERRVVDVNEIAHLTLTSRQDEVIGRDLLEFMPDVWHEPITEYVHAAISGSRPQARYMLRGRQWQATARRVDLPGHGPCAVCISRTPNDPMPLECFMRLMSPREVREAALGDLAILSDRELEVALLIGSGASDRQVAKHLHRSVRTVHAHRRTVGAKLGISTRAELVALVHDRGLVVFVDDGETPAPDCPEDTRACQYGVARGPTASTPDED